MSITFNLTETAMVNTLIDGGASFNLKGETPSSGYMVGGVIDPSDVIYVREAESNLPELLKGIAAMVEHLTALDSDNLYLGTWLDAMGTAVIEVSENIVDREAALSVGRSHGEDAIYDVAAKEDVNL